MEVKAVLDTNAVIYLQRGVLADSLPKGEYFISIITEMELLSYPELDEAQHAWLTKFINEIETVGIDEEIKQAAILLRRQYRLKLPDAIIAATAIVRDAVLYSNDAGLSDIPKLQIQKLALIQ